jgi:hypothetical protein
MIRRYAALAALMTAGMIVGAAGVKAQSALLNLPDVSQRAKIIQRLGITDITIDYHRPLVRGRKIFGGLVSYNAVWRAGANYNTTIEFSDPVTIEGQPLAKGIYGLHFIPGESSWIVIFSKNATSWGSFTYDKTEDALRVTVKPQSIENHEALSYDFGDPAPNSALITMRWEKVAVPIRVEVNTPEIVAQNLRAQLRGRVQFEWQAWQEAADYLLQNKLSAEEAAKYADTSVGIEDRFENEITKAKALRALGRNDEAIATQNKALEMGSQQQLHSFARGLQGIGQSEQALEIFRSNIKKDPNSWIAHSEKARLFVATGDYDTAVNEMKLAIAVAPDAVKGQLDAFEKALENKVDINK